MKKHLLALAALATVSGAAVAQSATIYGILDLSITSTPHSTSGAAGATADAGKRTMLSDAVWMPSVFGITGTEDLGGGLKASFNLESDVNVDTGALSAASGTNLFGRKANVNLTSAQFGTLTAGKDIDMLFLQGFIDNVRNSHSSSAFVAHTVSAAGNTLATDSVFTQNMIRYTTPTFNGFKASVQRRLGETAGDNSYNSSTAFLANYAANGLSVSVGTKKVNDYHTSTAGTPVAGNDAKTNYIGATYQLGQFRLATAHFETKPENTINSRVKIKTHEYGVGYSVTPSLTAAVNYVAQDNGGVDSKVTSGSLKYSLSKRTSVWALVSKTNNDATGSITGLYGTGVATGKDSTQTALGMTHSF